MKQMGNSQLVDYGIHKEESDFRIHVCIDAKAVYVYPTSNGVATIQEGDYRRVPVYTGSIKTAEGYLVPPSDIHGCRMAKMPDWVMHRVKFKKRDTTSEKGHKATHAVQIMMLDGLIPWVVMPQNIVDKDIQIQGTDIDVNSQAKIQVKCDWRGGDKEYGGTGNLFLQVAECNPFKQF